MPLSLEGRPDEDRAIRTIHAALDAGVTLIDTADAYALRRDRLRPQRAPDRQGAARAPRRRARRDQGRPHAARPGVGARRPARAHPRRVRGVAARARDRRDRPLPVPPPRPGRPLRRVDRRVPRPARRGQGALGRRLQRERRAARGGARDRRHRQRAEPARAGLHVADRQGRGRVRPTSTASRSCPGRRSAGSARRTAPPTSRRSRAAAEAHGVSPQQVVLAWLLALSPRDDPDPRLLAAGDDRGLRRAPRSWRCPTTRSRRSRRRSPDRCARDRALAVAAALCAPASRGAR